MKTVAVDRVQSMTVEAFVGMSSSSTQVQRAIDAAGPTFLDEVRMLVRRFAQGDLIRFPYRTELFMVHAP